jgi:hypothetical protein
MTTDTPYAPLCGDQTCEAWSCTRQARDEAVIQQENEVRSLFGRPPLTLAEEIDFIRGTR